MMITGRRAKPDQTKLNVYEIRNAIILAAAALRESTGLFF